jgi:hypothetical protein
MGARTRAREVMTMPELAAWRGVELSTARQDRYRRRDEWPAPVGSRLNGGRGRPELEYPAVALRALYPRPDLDRWDRVEIVDAETARDRLKVAWNTFRMYRAVYEGTANPFPAADEQGRWHWGVIADWKRRCPGSGRRKPGPAVASPVAAGEATGMSQDSSSRPAAARSEAVTSAAQP